MDAAASDDILSDARAYLCRMLLEEIETLSREALLRGPISAAGMKKIVLDAYSSVFDHVPYDFQFEFDDATGRMHVYASAEALSTLSKALAIANLLDPSTRLMAERE